MKNMLKFEFRKLFRSKSLYICSAIIISMAILSVVLMNLTIQIQIGDEVMSLIDPSDLSGINALMDTFSYGNILTILPIFIAIFVCSDASQGILKNVYAKGFSRTKVLMSKYIVSLVVEVIFFFAAAVPTFITASILWGNSADVNENLLQSLFGQIIVLLVYHTIYFAISTIVNKTGIAIALNIVGLTLFSLGLTAAEAVSRLVDHYVPLSMYWIETMWESVTTSSYEDFSYVGIIGLSFVYIAIFLGVSIFFNRKKQL